MIFWAGVRYPVWIHCCKCPNYDFCILQGSVATVLRGGGQNCSSLRHVSSRCCIPKIIKFGQCFAELFKQEAQLPQRNSASAAHMEGGGLGPPAHSPSGYTYAYSPMVESESHNVRTSSVPSVKRILRWIGRSRSFKVILVGASTNPERCVVVMCN